MKSKLKIIAVFFLLMSSGIFFPGKVSAQESNISFQVFYDQLSPYGQWIDYSEYGYVWIPDVDYDFVPYSTNGHWIYTDYGWTWSSDYDWGWATFHYGRWSFDDSFGWFWVPDNEWGPAWVNWRQADGYYGWSPMEPGISLNMSFGSAYDNRNDRWMFVRDRDIQRSDIHLYYINHSDQDRIGRNSMVIHNTFRDKNRHITYVSGPSRFQVQKVVGRNISPVVVRENNRPGQEIRNGQLRIYRPQVVRNSSNGRQSAPVRVTNRNEVKRSSSGNATYQNQNGNPVNRTNTQPVRTVTPQNNNSQPVQQRNANPQDNRQFQQNRISTPSNSNRNMQPVQKQPTTPVDINRPIRRPDAVIPMNNTSQPVQQRNATPQNNHQQPVQRQNVTPQNNNPQADQQRNATPQINNSQPVKRQIVTPQNNNQQPGQQRNMSPQNNNVRTDQQRNVSPQNNNQGQQSTPPVNVDNKTQPLKPQSIQPSNNRPGKEQKSINQQVRKEQEKIPDGVTDKK